MIIHEVNETNFEEEIKKGELEVQKKFDSWDKLGKLNIPIDEFKAKAAYLCRDPTIWAYSNLRDKQNKESFDRDFLKLLQEKDYLVISVVIDKKAHVDRLNHGECKLISGVVFLDMVDNLEKIGDHLSNIAQGILGGMRWRAG